MRGRKDVCKISSHPPGIHQVSEPLKAAQHSAQVSRVPGVVPYEPFPDTLPSAQGSSPQQSSLGQPHPQKVRTQEASPVVGQTPFHHTSLPVPAPHPLPTRLPTQLRPLLPRSFSLDPLMERRWDLDLTYVTERILAASFPARPDEQRHRGHLRELAHVLQSKHRDKYLVRGGTCFSQPMRGLGGPEGPGSSLTSNLWRRGPGRSSEPT